MAHIAFMHVVEGQKELEDYVSIVLLSKLAFLLNLSLNFTSLIEWNHQVKSLLDTAEVDFNHVHHTLLWFHLLDTEYVEY